MDKFIYLVMKRDSSGYYVPPLHDSILAAYATEAYIDSIKVNDELISHVYRKLIDLLRNMNY